MDAGRDRAGHALRPPGPGEHASNWAAPSFSDPVRLEEVDSTNRWLADAARGGAPHGLAVLAEHQVAGRGRRGRSWSDVPGASVLCSALFRPGRAAAGGGPAGVGGRYPSEQLYLVAGLVALAALDSLAEVASVEGALKWPNDVVVAGGPSGDRKLGGVLAELVDDSPTVVVGIGLNVGARPASGRDAAGPPTSVGLPAGAATVSEVAGRPVERDEVARALLEALERRAPALESDRGRSLLAEEHRARLATLGRPVRVVLEADRVEGVAVGLDGDGRLVVETADGRLRRFAAGDVVHLR